MKVELVEVEKNLIITALNNSYVEAYNKLKFNADTLGDLEKILIKSEIAITENLIHKIDRL